MTYAIIGTGAIGGYYGGRLAQAGREVHFLFHSDYEHVRANGLRVDSVRGDFHLREVAAYRRTADMPPCDVVLVGLKTIQNGLLKTLLPPLLHRDTVVVLIQNGLGMEDDLRRDFPALRIAGGTAFICSSRVGAGHITHLDYGELNIGGHGGTCPSEVLDAICADFRAAGVKSSVVDLPVARWRKLVWNIPFNGLSVVLNATTAQLVGDPSSARLAEDLMREVRQGAASCGCAIPEAFVAQMMDYTRKMKPYAPSMRLDFDAKRPMEVEYIYEKPCLAAAQAGFAMKKVEMLGQELRYIAGQF
jgi:2-dehydropantoate 2-reductase